MSIVILGGGVVGASVAYHLASRGVKDIRVLDRANAAGGGSTAKATGGFRAQFDNETEVRLSTPAIARTVISFSRAATRSSMHCARRRRSSTRAA
jgi:sarcosine oxidase subunit beta